MMFHRGRAFWIAALFLVGACLTWDQWPSIYADRDGHAVDFRQIYIPQLVAVLQICLVISFYNSRIVFYRSVFYVSSILTTILIGCNIRMIDLWRVHTPQAPQMTTYYAFAWASIMVTIGALVFLVRQSPPTLESTAGD